LKSHHSSQVGCQILKNSDGTYIGGYFSNFVGGFCFDIRPNDKTMFVLIEFIQLKIKFLTFYLGIYAGQMMVLFIDVRQFTMKNIWNLIENIQVLFIKFIGHHLLRTSFWVLVQIGQFDYGWLDILIHVWFVHHRIAKHFSMQFGRPNRQLCFFVSVKIQLKFGIYQRACTNVFFLNTNSMIFDWLKTGSDLYCSLFRTNNININCICNRFGCLLELNWKQARSRFILLLVSSNRN